MTDQEKAPERIWLDGDTETGDCPNCRGPFEDPKHASEPAIEYIRADLARKVKPLEWQEASFGGTWYASSIVGRWTRWSGYFRDPQGNSYPCHDPEAGANEAYAKQVSSALAEVK